jgi:hypothetical protein
MSASAPVLELEGILNPFRSGITRNAWDGDWVDVAEIHAGASARISQEVAAAERGGGCGILLFGEPGSGKTHLLNRLRQWCVEHSALFSGFRLQCGPQTIWRHLRREFAGDLLHRLPDGATQLERLLAAGPDLAEAVCSFSLARVLQHWREARHMRECEAWLRGDRLPERALNLLGISDEGADDEESAEDEARRILKELIALAAPSPVLLALDQVEAMQSDSQDPRGLAALGSAAAALRDETPNLVLVTCVQTSFLGTLENSVHRADLDRMGEVRIELLPLNHAEADALLAARLDAEPRLRHHPARRGDRLWPFTEYAVRHLLMRGPTITPRRLISAARDLFEQLKTGRPAEKEQDLTRFLRGELRRRMEEARASAASPGNEFILDGLRRLMPLAGWRLIEPGPPGVSLLAEKDGRTLALAVFNQEQMYGAARRLRKLASLPDVRCVRVVRAAALPIGRKAQKTREELERLEAAGARMVRLSTETLAALEACRTLLADAAAGDLHSDGETLPREFVEQWLRSNLSGELNLLVRDLDREAEGSAAQVGQAPAGVVEALIELIRERKIVAVEEAAAELGIEAVEARRCADQAADIVASVGRPAQVLFERRGA